MNGGRWNPVSEDGEQRVVVLSVCSGRSSRVADGQIKERDGCDVRSIGGRR